MRRNAPRRLRINKRPATIPLAAAGQQDCDGDGDSLPCGLGQRSGKLKQHVRNGLEEEG